MLAQAGGREPPTPAVTVLKAAQCYFRNIAQSCFSFLKIALRSYCVHFALSFTRKETAVVNSTKAERLRREGQLVMAKVIIQLSQSKSLSDLAPEEKCTSKKGTCSCISHSPLTAACACSNAGDYRSSSWIVILNRGKGREEA